MYIIQFEKGVYKADWFGDPGRTVKKGNAETFESESDAGISLNESIDKYPRGWENPQVIEI